MAAILPLLIAGCGDGSETKNSSGLTNSLKSKAEIACFDQLSAIPAQNIDLNDIETGLYSKKATIFPGVLFDISTGEEIQLDGQPISQLSDSSYVHLESDKSSSLKVTYINPSNLAAEFPYIDFLLERDSGSGDFFGKFYPIGSTGINGPAKDDPYVLLKLTSLSSSEVGLEACYPSTVLNNQLFRDSQKVSIDFVASSESTYMDLKRVLTETIEATTLIPEQVVSFTTDFNGTTTEEYSTFKFSNSFLLPVLVTAEITDSTLPTSLDLSVELEAYDQSFASVGGASGDQDTPAQYVVHSGETFYFVVTAEVMSEDYDPSDTITITLRQSYSDLAN